MESQMTHTFKKSAMSVPQLSPVEERSKESYSSSSSSSANKSGRCIDPFEPQFHESMLKLVPKHFWDNKKYRECNDCESQLCLKKLEKTCMTLGEFTLRFEKKIGSGNYATVYLATVVESHTLTDSEGIKKAVKVQTPPHLYEFYILETLEMRMKDVELVTDMVKSQHSYGKSDKLIDWF
jgi:hypothetical protein